MIRIGQLKLSPAHSQEELVEKILKSLRIPKEDLKEYKIVKQSIDARKKNDIKLVYIIDVKTTKEEIVVKKARDKNIQIVNPQSYSFVKPGIKKLRHRPVIIGSGPAGLFCAYMLALNGYQPIVLERGASVEERVEDVEYFWKYGILNLESNVQFGEGGAGTFSDGKLNTLVKDSYGRNRKVLEILVENGAPEDILFVNKPHIGTDLLTEITKNMRQEIIKHGGEVRFHSKVTNLVITHQRITQLEINNTQYLDVENVVLAIGHSARDTFSMLYEKQMLLESKSFAVGVRIEHPQDMINKSQYGKDELDSLPVAAYKLATKSNDERGVYSFCMCPGGYVVNASSEEKRLVVNGMSYQKRDGQNANSAIVVAVSPLDYNSEHPLAGVEFQRKLEEKAYLAGEGEIPIQCFGDFCNNISSKKIGEITPQIKGAYKLGNLRTIFPDRINTAIIEGIKKFEKKISGFAREDAILSGVESRTSSPVRIVRDEQLESNIKGIYPCGEGAGYAGGITSAAMDGIKIAEVIVRENHPFNG